MKREEIRENVKNGKVTHIIIEGVKHKLTISKIGTLCYIPSKTRVKPMFITNEMLEKPFELVWAEKKVNVIEEKKRKIYNAILKYRTYALKSENIKYAQDCINKIPATFEEWLKQGEPSLYDLMLISEPSLSIEGKVITIEGIEIQYPEIAKSTLDAIKNKTEYRSEAVRFRGYDMTVQITVTDDDQILGCVMLEFVGRNKSYNYMLINENCFIGYDIDLSF